MAKNINTESLSNLLVTVSTDLHHSFGDDNKKNLSLVAWHFSDEIGIAHSKSHFRRDQFVAVESILRANYKNDRVQ